MTRAMDTLLHYAEMDVKGRPWWAIAAWLFDLQVTAWAISLVVDRVWFPDTPYAFFAAMVAFGGYVFVDALTVGFGLKKAFLWGSAVTLGWIVGAIPYARRRAHLHRKLAG
jgi:hypothetical protein